MKLSPTHTQYNTLRALGLSGDFAMSNCRVWEGNDFGGINL